MKNQADAGGARDSMLLKQMEGSSTLAGIKVNDSCLKYSRPKLGMSRSDEKFSANEKTGQVSMELIAV